MKRTLYWRKHCHTTREVPLYRLSCLCTRRLLNRRHRLSSERAVEPMAVGLSFICERRPGSVWVCGPRKVKRRMLSWPWTLRILIVLPSQRSSGVLADAYAKVSVVPYVETLWVPGIGHVKLPEIVYSPLRRIFQYHVVPKALDIGTPPTNPNLRLEPIIPNSISTPSSQQLFLQLRVTRFHHGFLIIHPRPSLLRHNGSSHLHIHFCRHRHPWLKSMIPKSRHPPLVTSCSLV